MDVRPMFRGLPSDDGEYESSSERTRPMARTLIEIESQPPVEDPSMTDIKARIEGRGYRVDSELVAEAILRKMRLIRWARQELGGAAGHTPHPKLHGP
jgi:hypothetical protein